MSNINTIIFDLGKVLVNFDPEQLMRKLGFSVDTIQKLSDDLFSGLWQSMDPETLDAEATKRIFYQKLPEYDKDIDVLWEHLKDLLSERSYSSEWLSSLKSRGFRIYLLSNFSKASFEICSPGYQFMRYVDGGVISYEIGEIKPHKLIFDTLKERYHLNPEKCVFLDDSSVNIEAAISYGYHGIVFQSFAQASAELNTLLK